MAIPAAIRRKMLEAIQRGQSIASVARVNIPSQKLFAYRFQHNLPMGLAWQ
jgi:hypothetical protein